MSRIASLTTSKLQGIMVATGGVAETVAELAAQAGVSLPGVLPGQIVVQNVAAELMERTGGAKYPLVFIYCSKITNTLREKFRTFSGDANMVIEARVSQDRMDNIEANAQHYIDAITQVLDNNRGDWGDGVFYSGGYEVAFSGVKQGGRNFLQIAKVSFVLDISAD